MFFQLTSGGIPRSGTNCGHLIEDSWDDWFQFRTTFTLIIFDEEGSQHRLGTVKISHMGLRPAREIAPGQRAPELPTEFDALDESYFSLGQGEDYYETLNKLSQGIRERVLVGLRDCAYNLARTL